MTVWRETGTTTQLAASSVYVCVVNDDTAYIRGISLSPNSSLIGMDGCLSTLVDLDHAEIHRLFASEEYVNATNHISLPGKERVTAATLKSLLEKRQNLKKAVRCGTDREVRKTYWLSTAAISRPGDAYRMALKDVSEEGRPLCTVQP